MSEQATLRPYSADAARCPKCGGLEVGTHYRREREYMPCYNVAGCPRGEHLHRICRRCHYEWPEACIGEEKPTNATDILRRIIALDDAVDANSVMWLPILSDRAHEIRSMAAEARRILGVETGESEEKRR